MLYKNILLIIFFLFFSNCSTKNFITNKPNIGLINNYTNSGFTLIYNENLYKDKIVSQQIDERSITILQKNLKKNMQVKITNILNNKSLIANVGKKIDYPSFYNSVISIRIANELEVNINEPYIEIKAISENSVFVAKKAKTHDEEKNIANKVPVKSISIDDLNVKKTIDKNIPNIKFSYIVKIADFYFSDTASNMVNRIKAETNAKKIHIKKIFENKYRVYLGPFDNINSLQKSFNDIEILEFENIEIIKND